MADGPSFIALIGPSIYVLTLILACLFALLPCKPLQEPGPFIAARHRLPGLVDYRISQVSGDSIPYLCPALRPRLVCLVSPWRPDSAVPIVVRMKTPCALGYRGSITRLQYLLLTLQVVRCRTRMQSSLRGCWLGFAGRESNPLESSEWFPPILRCFPHSQTYPGAIHPPQSALIRRPRPRCG